MPDSTHPILARGTKVRQPQIPEDLELLADFVADVGVLGMQFGQSIRVGVDVGESEFEFA
jgi:hypothetical protein